MTRAEKELLAIELLETMPIESRHRVIASVSREGFSPGYEEIVARRVEEIKSGKVECRPHSELMREMRDYLANA